VFLGDLKTWRAENKKTMYPGGSSIKKYCIGLAYRLVKNKKGVKVR